MKLTAHLEVLLPSRLQLLIDFTKISLNCELKFEMKMFQKNEHQSFKQ